MEAKGEAKSEAGGKAEGGGPPNTVVINLLNFAMRVVHEEMAGFFDDHCSLWDYGEEELKAIMAGGGETLEQHAIFTKYLELINGHLDGFARSAGYTSAKDVFEAVEAAVEHDKKQREKMMAEMNTMFAQMRLKPIGLEYLLDSVLNLAEYETLRMMMIMKARERRMYRQLAERGERRRRLAAARREDLVAGCPPRVVVQQYEALKARLAEMTPHRKDLHEELDAGMASAKLEDDADRGGAADGTCYDYPVDFLVKVSSPTAAEARQGDARDAKVRPRVARARAASATREERAEADGGAVREDEELRRRRPAGELRLRERDADAVREGAERDPGPARAVAAPRDDEVARAQAPDDGPAEARPVADRDARLVDDAVQRRPCAARGPRRRWSAQSRAHMDAVEPVAAVSRTPRAPA
ncbi:hypothetical protein JL722_14880 [Aureococcus anophagefferens]|nr:hypothetical protein JL722_14880 [Aureococcus anophagefferens]